jgi:hypothetical protein
MLPVLPPYKEAHDIAIVRFLFAGKFPANLLNLRRSNGEKQF